MASPLCDALHLVKKVRQRVYLNFPKTTSINVNNYQYGETDLQIYSPDITQTFASTAKNFQVVLSDPALLRGLNFKIRVMTALATNIEITCALPCITYNYPCNPSVSTNLSSFVVPVAAVGDEILVNSQGDQWYVTLVSFHGGTLFVANTTGAAKTVPVQCITALDNIVVQSMNGNLRLELANYTVNRGSVCRVIVQNVTGTCSLTLAGTFGNAAVNHLSYSLALGGIVFAQSAAATSLTIAGITSGALLTVVVANGKAYINGGLVATSVSATSV